MTDKPDEVVHPLVAFEMHPDNHVSVAEDSRLSDPRILKTLRLLNRAKRDANGLTVVPAGALHVRTSPDQRERALRTMQTLFTAFEARGFPVTASDDGVRVTILKEILGVGIEEQTNKVEHRTTFTEQKLIERGQGWQVPKVDLVPSGILTGANGQDFFREYRDRVHK
jgi:hypothetical protein